MKQIINFFLDRSLVVNLFTLAVLLAGAFSIYGLKKEVFPNVDFNVIKIVTTYPGTSSEDVEKLVTMEIERKLKGVSGIKTLNALSLSGMSLVIVIIDQDYNQDKVYDDVRNSVESLDGLPDGVKLPEATLVSSNERGIIQIVLTGEDYGDIRRQAKALEMELERIPEISAINLDGYLVDEIHIEIDPKKLNYYQITAGEITKAIQMRNLSLSAGTLKSEQGNISVRVISEFKKVSDIENVVVRSNYSGKNIKISDIAKVTRGPSKSEVKQRANGKRAIFISVKIKETADILRSTEKLKNVVKTFFDNRYSIGETTVQYSYVDDLSYWVKRRLNVLIDNGTMGFILVFLCLLALLNFRTSVVTSLGAPIAFMMSFIVMEYIGVTLNLISMFSLIMVLGMLVDDAIIVAEYYFQKLEQGALPKDAAREAALETIKPVSATIITTMVAFGSFYFMTGTMGKLVWTIPTVVIICLAASLFECYVILPSHLMDFVRLEKTSKRKEKWYQGAVNFYRRVLGALVRFNLPIVIVFFLCLIVSILVARTMRVELFPGDDSRVVYMQIKGKINNTLEQTDEIMRLMENIVSESVNKDELDQIKAQVGRLIEMDRVKTGPHYGSLILYLTPPNDRKRATDEIVADLAKKFNPILDGYVLTALKLKGGPPRGKPVDIELSGDNLEELLAVTKEIQIALKKIVGITTTEIDYEEGKQQIAVVVKEEEARRLGVTTRDVALELRRFFSEDSFSYIREQGEDIDIKIIIDEKSKSRVETLNLLYVVNRQGSRIPISRLIEITKRPTAFVIRRKDRKRTISLTAEINTKKVTPVGVVKQISPTVKGLLKEYPSIKVNYGGENEETKESIAGLFKAFLLATILIFLILVVMFGSILQSFVVMMAIPLGLVGVIITFKIAAKSLSFMALLGVVALVGVVVNDSIVLVNFINKVRKREKNLYAAVIEASVSRFRPVILTTVTTVASLLFLAHPLLARVFSFGLNSDSDPFLQPMAMSFAWGLLFASLITLIFIPCAYIVADRLSRFITGLRRVNR